MNFVYLIGTITIKLTTQLSARSFEDKKFMFNHTSQAFTTWHIMS